MRLIVAMVGGVLALLCLGGVGVFISFYDQATKIQRTDPDVVVSSYLRAALVNRDNQEASLYVCKSGADLQQITSLAAEVAKRERDFGVAVSVNWGTLVVSGTSGSRQAVVTELTIAGTSNGQPVSQRTESWRFDVVDEDGWRVCGATKVS
ncbi:hypothetical protein [Actinoplanes sp. TFC3]|uniref:hypothetical protein n=1 Tax=Actinoplanes sp. TFC3 TaxID=1710355 RepID=UPI0008317A9B|nr:hypothetical protein [Actinoplanes sp. TFC3]